MGYWNLEVDFHIGGAFLRVGDMSLTNGCMFDGEVDAQVRRLKEAIDNDE